MTPITSPERPVTGSAQRLEPLLLQLREVLRARVVERVVTDERGLAVLCRPPGEPSPRSITTLPPAARRAATRHAGRGARRPRPGDTRSTPARRGVRHQSRTTALSTSVSSSDDATVETICWSVFSPFAAPFRGDRTTPPPCGQLSALFSTFAGTGAVERHPNGRFAPLRDPQGTASSSGSRCRRVAAVADVKPERPRPQSADAFRDLAPADQWSATAPRSALVRARVEDLGDLLREPELVVGGEVVQAQADAGVGAKSQRIALASSSAWTAANSRTRSTTVPPRRSGSRALVTSKPAASARSMRSCVCRRSSREFGRPRSPPRGRTRPSPHSGRRRSECPSGTAPRLSLLHLLLERERARVRLPAGEGRL